MQSMARNAGKGVSQAKNMKEQMLAEVPEEVTQISQQIARIPLSPQQAVQMLMSSEKEQNPKANSMKPKPKEGTLRLPLNIERVERQVSSDGTINTDTGLDNC